MADWFTENSPAQQDWFSANAPTAAVAEPSSAEQYGQDLPSGEELTQIGRENTPAWAEAPAEAVKELVVGMAPHDLRSYAEGVFPPLAAFRQGQQLAQGDVSSIPFAGRVPEIMAAEKTPALSKERYLAAMKTLMDVGMLAGAGGERAPSPLRTEPLAPEPPPTVPSYRPTTIAQDVSRALAEQRVPEVNRQLAPEQPTAPSMAEATEPAPKVREAISPDEIRLMRERDELQAQNDIAQRATGQTHPAVDERLDQIDQELTDIGNRELETVGPPPVEAVPPPPIGKQLEPKPFLGPNGETPAADAAARAVEVPVRHGEFAKPGYTAVTPAATEVSAPGISHAQYKHLQRKFEAGHGWTDEERAQVLAYENPPEAAPPPEGPVQAQEAPTVAPEAPGGVPVAEPAGEPPPSGAGAPVIPPEDVKYAGGGPQTEVPGTVGISQARTEAELGPGSVVPGAGAEMGSGLAHGRDYINKGGDPRLPIRRANTSGMVGKNDVGIVHAELDRLRVERSKAAAALEANPGDPVLQQNFSVADDAQRAWRKELQPVLTKASDALREAHAASMPDADVSTYQGLADLMDEHFKGERTLSPEERTALAKAAKGVKESRNIANGEMAKVEGALEKQARVRGKKALTPDELETSIRNRLETEFTDCVLGA